MSSPDDDLHGRQLVLLLVFFCGFGGLLYFLGWLARPSFLYDNPLACAAIAGFACYPARFLVEQFDWWNRLEQPTRRTRERRDRALKRALAKARQAAKTPRTDSTGSKHRRPGPGRSRVLTVGWMAIGGLLVLGALAIAPFGIVIAVHDQTVARHAPVQQAVVLSVSEDKWSRSKDVTITVARPADGVPVDIYGTDELRQRPEVGDLIAVYVDPDDSTNVLAAEVDWTVRWYVYVGFVLASLVGAVLVGGFFFG